jgi:hypothetical protein
MDAIKVISNEIEGQSLNAIVAGFSFAAAISWMDLTRWIIPQITAVQRNGGSYFLITALMTTLLSIIVFMVLSRVSKAVVKPQGVVYAVGR